MVFSVWFYANIQWHWTFFYSFFYIKKGIKFFEYFWKTCKKPLLEQNFSLIKINFSVIFSWLKFCPNHWAIFSRKKFAQHHKKSPKWQNFTQSGHPEKEKRRMRMLSARTIWSSYRTLFVVLVIAYISMYKIYSEVCILVYI